MVPAGAVATVAGVVATFAGAWYTACIVVGTHVKPVVAS